MISIRGRKNSTKTVKKMTASLLMLFLSTFFFSMPQPAKADYWGSTYAAAMMKQMMEQIQRQVEGALLGTLKMTTIQMLNSKVGQLVGGGTGSQPLYITNFNEFLYQTPTQNANLYMNDFFSMTTRGKGSTANYAPAGGSNGIGDNYVSYLISAAKNATTENNGVAVYNLEEYTPNPSTMFATGDFRGLNAFFSNPANNTFGYTLQAQEAYQNQIEMNRQTAMIKAISAGGFLPDEKNGMVVAPAGTIQAAVTNVQDLGNKMIATATNPGELLSGVVSAMANKLVSNLIQNGVGEVQSKINREIRNIDVQVSQTVNAQTKTFGPAVQYMGNTNQNVNVGIRTNTPVPPAAISPNP